MRKRIFNLLLILLVVCLTAFPAQADWVNLSGAQSSPNIVEIYVEDDQVRLVMEIYVKDIDKFIDLLPDEWLQQAGMTPPPIDMRMQRFSTVGFQIVTNQQQRLMAKLKQVEPRMRKKRPNPFAGSINPYTRRLVPGPPEDKRVLYAELSYPFERRPESLTFIPPLDGLHRVSVCGFRQESARVRGNQKTGTVDLG